MNDRSDDLTLKLENLSSLHRQFAELNQRLLELEKKSAQLDVIADTFSAQVAWKDGRSLSFDALHEMHAELEDKVNQWNKKLTSEQPQAQVDELERQVQDVERKKDHLRFLSETLGRLEIQVEKQSAFVEKKKLIDGAKQLKEDLDATLSENAELLGLSDERQQLMTAYTDRLELRRNIENMARHLAETTSIGQVDAWAQKVFDNIARLAQLVGKKLPALEKSRNKKKEEFESINQKFRQLQEVHDTEAAQLFSMQARLDEYSAVLSSEARDLMDWGTKMEEAEFCDEVDGTSKNALLVAQKKLNARLDAIKWYANGENILLEPLD